MDCFSGYGSVIIRHSVGWEIFDAFGVVSNSVMIVAKSVVDETSVVVGLHVHGLDLYGFIVVIKSLLVLLFLLV